MTEHPGQTGEPRTWVLRVFKDRILANEAMPLGEVEVLSLADHKAELEREKLERLREDSVWLCAKCGRGSEEHAGGMPSDDCVADMRLVPVAALRERNEVRAEEAAVECRVSSCRHARRHHENGTGKCRVCGCAFMLEGPDA